MNKKQHDEIMKEFKKQLISSYTKGVVVGLKLGAHYVEEKLGTPEEWVKLDSDGLMDKLSEGLAMAVAIKNNKLDTEVTEELEESDDHKVDIENNKE